ncbi:GTP-binding protein [uncultured Draconibacterium sp.]|uniref:GTP-binding protein n=1 Tax=uncultured Draconibacterium sp. TaxID=1573823 RepID=UPI003217446D
MKNKARLILVGGFLGAGKTTLLSETTRKLMAEGKKVGLITNDQAAELVDTAFLLKTTSNVAEVSGSCFCCNFNGFVDSVRDVEERSNADILIAEPVGSCTDLSATIVQPIKKLYSEKMLLSPLSVLADPFKLEDILNGGTAGLHTSAAYIYKKQLEESEVIVITKTDKIDSIRLDFLKEKIGTIFPHTKVMSVSSRTGEGISDWLNYVLNNSSLNNKTIEVDYNTYAEGEAVLGWLNASANLKGEEIDWDEFAGKFLAKVGYKIESMKLSVGHIKIMIQNGSDYLIGNITNDAGSVETRGSAGISDKAQIIINARVGLSPDTLENLVRETLNNTASSKIEIKVNAWNCISPGYPNPTFRYN